MILCRRRTSWSKCFWYDAMQQFEDETELNFRNEQNPFELPPKKISKCPSSCLETIGNFLVSIPGCCEDLQESRFGLAFPVILWDAKMVLYCSLQLLFCVTF